MKNTQTEPLLDEVEFEDRVFLKRYLQPLQVYLDQEDVSEVCVNQAGEVWVERMGAVYMERHENNELTSFVLDRLARLLAGASDQKINEEKPLLSTILPAGERVQVVRSPAAPLSTAISIRRQVVRNLSLEDYDKSGAFNSVDITTDERRDHNKEELKQLLADNKIKEFLHKAITTKKNILVSGGTSTGKTTFLNALLGAVDERERILTIEDTQEVKPIQKNWLSLIASKGQQGQAKVTIQDLLEAALRLRPDRILLGELRGAEAFSFLRMVNTGHPGSITTIHADTPNGAFEQLVLMVMQSDMKLERDAILTYIKSVIDIVIQLKRVDGKRVISEIWWPE